MIVHDIHKNETKVINFQGTAPETLTQEMLLNVSELKVKERQHLTLSKYLACKTTIIFFLGRFASRSSWFAQRSAPSSQLVWEVKESGVFSAELMFLCKHILPQNHCSLPWEDVVSRVTAVAREGFNVSFSLGESNHPSAPQCSQDTW